MLRPDQVKLRLEQAMRTNHEESCWLVLALVYELLPDLVEATQQRRDVYGDADAGRRYGDAAAVGRD
jgi:uncharacterized protein HemY